MDRERPIFEKQAQEDGNKIIEKSNQGDNKWRQVAPLRGCRGGNRGWTRIIHAGNGQNQPNKPAHSQAETKKAPYVLKHGATRRAQHHLY